MADSTSIRSPASWVSFLVLACVAAWIYWYVRSHPAVLESLRDVSLASAAALALLSIAIFASNGLTTVTVLRAFGKTLPHRDAFLLSTLTTAANYILPARSGAGLRAVYLKRRVAFDFTDFATTLAGLYVLAFAVNGVLGLASTIGLALAGRPFDVWIALAFAASAVAAAVIVLLPALLPARLALAPADRVLDGWRRLRRQPSLLAKLAAISAAQTATMLLQTLVAFAAIGADVPLTDALFFTAAKGLALLATITPGALGIVEGLSVYTAQHLSFSPDQAFAAQSLMRALTIASAFVLAPVAVVVLGTSKLQPSVVGSESL